MSNLDDLTYSETLAVWAQAQFAIVAFYPAVVRRFAAMNPDIDPTYLGVEPGSVFPYQSATAFEFYITDCDTGAEHGSILVPAYMVFADPESFNRRLYDTQTEEIFAANRPQPTMSELCLRYVNATADAERSRIIVAITALDAANRKAVS
jgi:hypothetical protein